MGIIEDKIKDLREREAKILQMGGEKAVEKQKKAGKLTARERLDVFFDPGTFRELDMFVSHRCVHFGMEKVEIPSDGVITGHGLVDGRPVFAFAQDLHREPAAWVKCTPKKYAKLWIWLSRPAYRLWA